MGAGELLALAAALCFGVTHVVNGLLARRVDGAVVALWAQLGGTVVSLALPLLFPAAPPSWAALGWGALSGLGTGLGVAWLYRAMGKGALSVVVPVSDVGAVALPVLAGLTLWAERPSLTALLGMALALPAIGLLSRSGGERLAAGAGLAALSGIGFAVQFVAMARLLPEDGFWPVVASRVVSVLVIRALCRSVRAPARVALGAVGAGALGTVAVVCYLLSAQRQLLTVAVVLSALYPVIPVLVALLFLRERVSRAQVLGLVGAAAAVVLIAWR
ncbi:drug/metabolite transporter (DMT)-like permease [Crossiella equi]|uniref:Drug/metabolite transporter (DMT)-like permease n=1 Tax=Crossiella equi TaxID=130796 RepID=A0ABS5A4S8_9PSEU|nr:EamA family transporter [Crossiella equi]MBP2471590.1 drug/metabolite transporter (DMT)-like permease [Crossiella equi]